MVNANLKKTNKEVVLKMLANGEEKYLVFIVVSKFSEQFNDMISVRYFKKEDFALKMQNHDRVVEFLLNSKFSNSYVGEVNLYNFENFYNCQMFEFEERL